jgi:hypothetical protein
VQQDHVFELAGVQHLGDGLADVVVHRVHAGMDERRALVVDQELVELEVQAVGVGGGDPVDPVDDLVDPRQGWLLSRRPSPMTLREATLDAELHQETRSSPATFVSCARAVFDAGPVDGSVIDGSTGSLVLLARSAIASRTSRIALAVRPTRVSRPG